MSNNNDIIGFVKDPSKLVELCRDVIDQLDASSDAGLSGGLFSATIRPSQSPAPLFGANVALENRD